MMWLVNPRQMAQIVNMLTEGMISRETARLLMNMIYDDNLARLNRYLNGA